MLFLFKATVALAIYLYHPRDLKTYFFVLNCCSRKVYFLSKEGAVCNSVTVLKEIASEYKVRKIS